jgi:GGDEF domain-containing protein
MTHAEQRDRFLEATMAQLATLGQSPVESEILQTSIRALADLLQVRYGAISLLDEHGELCQFVHTGINRDDVADIPHPHQAHGFLGMVSHHDTALKLGETADAPRSQQSSQKTSLLAVTIAHQGKLYGRIYLSDRLDQQAFSEEDENLSFGFAKVLALILDHARKFGALTQSHGELSHSAHHDALTNLPNRALLRDRIGQVLCHAIRNQTLVAVLFCDLDGFKTINDSLGHQAGDASLVSLYYYLQVIRQMYVSEAEDSTRFKVPLITQGAVIALTVGVLFVGLYPAPLFEVTDQVAAVLFTS